METLLEMLKVDLGINRDNYDDRLTQLLEASKAAIETEGITLYDTFLDYNLIVMYAAWMWNERRTGEGMPRMLRYQLNNRLMQQKGQQTWTM